MRSRTRPARAYRGGHRGRIDLSVKVEKPTPPPGTPGGPGRLDLLDLAFRPDEKRIPKGLPHAGEWTSRPNMTAFRFANGATMEHDEAINAVGGQYDWAVRDKELSVKADAPAIRQQDLAQIAAKNWASNQDLFPEEISYYVQGGHGSLVKGSSYAAMVWSQYQNPTDYQIINHALRTPGDQVSTLVDDQVAQSEPRLRGDVDRAFAEGGWSLEQDTTLYRALKSEPGGMNWAETLKPGTTFTETGIVSTTAHSKASKGWLFNTADGSGPRQRSENDVVMEVRVPKGTRVLGGDPQFIETMLKPGSKFKVISSEHVAMKGAANPLGGKVTKADEAAAGYTHVVVELQP